MQNVYVLDTNVILRDYTALYAFGEALVVIPSVVLEEIDSKKKEDGGVGLNARAFSREVDKLRGSGKLTVGVRLHNGGTLRVDIIPEDSPVYDTYLSTSNDNAILATAFALLSDFSHGRVVLVSLDVNVRVKANTVGLEAEDYDGDRVLSSADEQYKGFRDITVDPAVVNALYSDKALSVDALDIEVTENEFILLKHGSQSGLGRVSGNRILPLYRYTDDPVWGLKARNVGQKMAMDLLLDPTVPLVTLTGKAGTGKTLLALATGLKQTLDDGTYRKVLVARPVVPMGKDLGYLPGDKDEKLRPWMQPIYDNLEQLFETKKPGDLEKVILGMSESIQVEALTYIRGRSIPNQFIIIDEAQNLTKHEVKTILTRAGEGSKVVLLGDPGQIDHPFLDQFSNGLTYASEKLKGSSMVGHIHLEKGERSKLAQMCADLL